ncbi:adenylate/guanylate cyclase domain-containing protein [Oceanispirochaeta sp.]|uniref:adenylate/guanylate cyclase domain-containing protein n=1 Tax=Oceanispirochaeta sp. TaxID=2035350 RepID=UPI002614D823|nr:adenylate/guanylate cyclase domain-containing protein [Oceanispirochaeta sp.]MDA3958948.1 adenylate/guanylate cyclase domain-containing protein [Oceanispirochaeta sp.]
MSEAIFYLEGSSFLSGTYTALFSEYKWQIFQSEEAFIQAFFHDPPPVCLLGDTGSEHPVELLFCIKSIKGFNKIPILFCGEHDFIEILPVDYCLSRDPDSFDRGRKILDHCLNRGREILSSRGTWQVPDGFASPGFLEQRARFLIREEISLKYLQSELEGLDITDLTFAEVLGNITSRLSDLVDADFVFIHCFSPEFHMTHLHSRLDMTVDMMDKLASACLKKSEKREGVPPILPAVSTGGFAGQVDSEHIRIISSRKLIYEGISLGHLTLGSLMNADSHIPGRLAARCGEMVSALLQRSMTYYRKIEDSQTIYSAFSQFLPSAIIDDLLLKESEKALLTGEKRNITVLFSHMRKFDFIAENNEPGKVVSFLNDHFTNMVRIIQSHGGTIDKFIGDAVFALFGAPISYLDNTRRAAEAALEMIRRYNEISIDGLILPEEGFSIGIGLNEGEAIIGNIGCSDKFDYTAIGDTVNLAARLESLTKYYHQDILISRVVWESLRKEYYCRLVDRAKVKGKSTATEIYSLVVNPALYTPSWQKLFMRALKMYTLGNWYSAAEYLEKALNLLPEDLVSQILLERCLDYQIVQPENWDGSVILDFK